MNQVVADETRNDDDFMGDAIEVINAGDTPRYKYDAVRKAYE